MVKKIIYSRRIDRSSLVSYYINYILFLLAQYDEREFLKQYWLMWFVSLSSCASWDESQLWVHVIRSQARVRFCARNRLIGAAGRFDIYRRHHGGVLMRAVNWIGIIAIIVRYAESVTECVRARQRGSMWDRIWSLSLYLCMSLFLSVTHWSHACMMCLIERKDGHSRKQSSQYAQSDVIGCR